MYLVTGGAGFIGSHLVEELVARGARVRVLDNFSSGRWENLASVADAVEIIEGDVTDLQAVLGASRGVEYVLHHAAIASVARSVQDPIETQRVNVEGTLNVLLGARQAAVKRFVFASSAAVYGDAARLPLTEETPQRSLSPYAASKSAGEAYVQAFAASFGLPGVSLRYFNVYGPRQDPASPYSGVITKFVTALQNGQAPTIFGDGLQTRDFVYVRDVVRANLLACACEEAVGQVFNVASGRQTGILQLAHMLGEVLGRPMEPRFAAPLVGGVRHSRADVSRSRQVMDWQVQVDLPTGLALTLAQEGG
jgi:nucleoside-diphosphate-sugar epimerase